jgi:hypothetical protein
VVIIENIVPVSAAEEAATQGKVNPPQELVTGPVLSIADDLADKVLPASKVLGVYFVDDKPESKAATIEARAATEAVKRAEPDSSSLLPRPEQVQADTTPEPRGDTAESDAGSGKLSVPAQLRRHSRAVRPSKVSVATPDFVPAPYPHHHHQPSAPSSAGTTTGSIGGSIGGSRRSSVNYPTDFSDIPEDTYVMPTMQSIAPSAIIAAARESIRQAEGATVEGGGNARGLPPRNRSLCQSY